MDPAALPYMVCLLRNERRMDFAGYDCMALASHLIGATARTAAGEHGETASAVSAGASSGNAAASAPAGIRAVSPVNARALENLPITAAVASGLAATMHMRAALKRCMDDSSGLFAREVAFAADRNEREMTRRMQDEALQSAMAADLARFAEMERAEKAAAAAAEEAAANAKAAQEAEAAAVAAARRAAAEAEAAKAALAKRKAAAAASLPPEPEAATPGSLPPSPFMTSTSPPALGTTGSGPIPPLSPNAGPSATPSSTGSAASGVATIKLTDLNGHAFTRRFSAFDPLAALYAYAESLEGYDGRTFELVVGFPPKRIARPQPGGDDAAPTVASVPELLPRAVVKMRALAAS
jgi:hypothetical protein